MKTTECRIGCAGWNLPKDLRRPPLSYLERYAELFNCVEINSSFYRHHQQTTYARWAAAVPDNFLFSVKIPKAISHTQEDIETALVRFLDEIRGLGVKLGPLLLQFPPKASFQGASRDILLRLRENFDGEIVCEPRHGSWFEAEASALMMENSISLVGADPKPASGAPDIFEQPEIRYFRLHGAPRIYYSEYSADFLERMKTLNALQRAGTWLIFDNTALGHGYRNALAIAANLGGRD